MNNFKYLHYGDILFYLPLIIYLKENFKIKIYASTQNINIISYLLKHYKNINIVTNQYIREPKSLTIVHPYEYLKYKKENVIGLGLPVEYLNDFYPSYLIKSLERFLGYTYHKSEYHSILNEIREHEVGNKKIGSSAKYIFISPFMASGKFRDIINSKKKEIIKAAIDYAEKKNLEIILVGSNAEKLSSYKKYNIIDKRNDCILDSISLVRSTTMACGVGFDNFWMHYCNIIKKPYKVVFRGRFTKIPYINHTHFINTSFFSQ